uniref:Kinesin-like protein n=1 Tax=Oryzias melastigma TaxID=30732 RepID=A0A3B3BYZ4_ORYME
NVEEKILQHKIRVFCRLRPMNRNEAGQGGATVVGKVDDYSVSVETPRGLREFQFDKVFGAEASLIQSVIDGYNVCIFAYGQTGSGKTFTMVGDKDQRNPGIMPRSFNAIFDITRENSSKFEFKVSAYMLELYNDRLQDLFVSQAAEAQAQTQPSSQTRRVEIKRTRKGVVFAQGAETKEASSAQELYALFQQACANRHIAATMNVESSRSHLIIVIMVESRNLTNGSVSTGKLSLVDLAGSERAAKTGAKDHQLKEANSINKSLSALGDVISALSADLPHVPYRNSKLTQYATRVKAITNNAQRNVESKEIAQLKEVIMRLKSGQTVDDGDV